MVKAKTKKDRREKDWLDKIVEWLRPGCHIAHNPKKGKRGPRKKVEQAKLPLTEQGE